MSPRELAIGHFRISDFGFRISNLPFRASSFDLRIFLLLLAFLPAGCDEEPPTHLPIELAGRTFQLELALTDAERREGMMGRETLGKNRGILFAFPDEQIRRFWMKNCHVPLDVLYLDAEGRIVSIRTMSVPDPGTPDHQLRRYSSRWPARFAIELRAGRAEQLGLAEGDELVLPLDRLKNLAR